MAPKPFKACKKCVHELDERSERIVELEGQNGMLSAEVAKLETSGVLFEQRVSGLETQNASLSATLAETETKGAQEKKDQEVQYLSRIRELTEQKQAGEEKLRSTTRSYEQRVCDLERECESSRQDVEHAVKEQNELKELNKALEGKLNDLRACQGAESQVAAGMRRDSEIYQKRVAELTAKLSTIEEALQGAQATIVSRDASIEEKTRQLQVAETSGKEKAQQCVQLKCDIDSQIAEGAKLRKEISQLTAQLRDCQKLKQAAELGDSVARRLSGVGSLLLRGSLQDMAQWEVERNLTVLRSESEKLQQGMRSRRV